MAIGYGASVSADNEVYIGNSTTASIGGIVNWTATSDGRFKTDVQENVSGLDFINRLRPVTYHMDANAWEQFHGKTLPENLQATADQKAQLRYTGFIAQEVELAAEQSGFDFSGVKVPQNDQEAYGLRYAEFVVPLVKAVQELSETVETQKQQIQQQQQLLSQYQAALENMVQRVGAIENKSEASTVSQAQ